MDYKKKLFSSIISDIAIVSENVETGVITKHPTMHNLVTDSFKKLFLQSTAQSTGLFSPYLRVGCGTAAPTVSDMALTIDNNWYSNNSGISIAKRKIVIASLNSVAVHLYYVIPASAQYVGTITELGLYETGHVYDKNHSTTWSTRAAQLITHSLLKDAEGHPYSINKTDLDQLTIEYKITFTSQDFPLALLVCGVRSSNPIADAAGNYIHRLSPTGFSGLGAWGSNFTGGVSPLIRIIKPLIKDGYIYDQGFSVGGNANGIFLDRRLDMYSISPNGSIGGTAASISACCNDGGQLTVPARRMPAPWYRNGYYILGFSIHALSCSGTALLQYFKDDLGYQDIDLDDYVVGVGDGITTAFKPPLNYWKANTEEIYIDGVKAERGIDYTCDPHNNLDNLPMFLPLTHAVIIDAEWANMYNSSSDVYLESPAAQPNEIYQCNSGLTSPRIFNTGGSLTVVPRLGIAFKDYNNADIYYEPALYGIAAARHPVTLLSAQDDPTTGIQEGILSSLHPYVFELPIEETALDWSVDSAYLYTEDNNASITFSVAYSDDAENWTTVVSHVSGFKTRPSGNAAPHQRSLSEWCEYSLGGNFTKKYWRLSIHYDAVTPSPTPIYTNKRIGFILKHTGGNIVFTNPPAAGASITMSAKSDILFKDSVHVVDCGGTISM